jgi:cytochrome c556
MKRMFGLAALLALVVGVSASPMAASADDKDDKVPTIKQIMKKAHGGPKSLLGKIGTELKSDDPDWPKVAEMSKELVGLADALGKNTPPKGEVSDFKKRAGGYKGQATILEKAAEKKMKTGRGGAEGAFKALRSSCMGCHAAHRPK